ncbi:aldo/keto reductase [Rheinheimera sp.]|uniref:aldo/keto reductase n=1 Tax=Rheinheimera sp. TaxID=1869214 RepID=UPI00307E2024
MTTQSLSSDFTKRIGFGCGRLVGGSSFKDSAFLIEEAVRLGISYFDTAPSYGLGTADDVLGEVLCGDENYEIASKVGISRPKSASTLSFLRKFVGPLVKRSVYLKRMAGNYIKTQSSRNEFDSGVLLESFEDTLLRLKRRSVQRLFLHEGVDKEYQGNTIDFFNQLVQGNRIKHFGQATSGTVFSPYFGDLIQFSILSDLHKARLNYKFVSAHGVFRSSLNDASRNILHDNVNKMMNIEKSILPRDCENIAKLLHALSLEGVDKLIVSFKCPEQMKRTLFVVNEIFCSR